MRYDVNVCVLKREIEIYLERERERERSASRGKRVTITGQLNDPQGRNIVLTSCPTNMN